MWVGMSSAEEWFLYVAISMTHGADQCGSHSWKLSALPDISLLMPALGGGLESPPQGGEE